MASEDLGRVQGATFTPSVSTDGVISWTNDAELPNPQPQNIKGEAGEKGDKGDKGDAGDVPANVATLDANGKVEQTAKVADTADSATHATTADSATHADTATSATNATLINNVRIRHITFTPYQINRPSEIQRILGPFGIGIFIFSVSWENYPTYPHCGGTGYFMLTGGSGYLSGFMRDYADYNWTYACRAVDGISNLTGWQHL